KRELQESLEHQIATSEVLNVISRSPSELQPVFDAIVQTARRLCQSERVQLFRLNDGKYHLAAHQGTDPKFLNFLKENPISPDGIGSPTGKAARERRTIHLPDVLADPEFARYHVSRGAAGRSLLCVPLIHENVAIGVITLSRTSVKPFTRQQIDLVKTFADQAVIAIENTRLFEEVKERTRELQESLEYQTATSDVLGVISRSPTELQPILDSIAATAARLCESVDAQVFRVQDGK